MTPWQLAKTSEHSHQRALFAWANCAATYGFYVAQYGDAYTKATRERWFEWASITPDPAPEMLRLFAVHNQGHGDAIRGGRAKAEGVKAGVPDVMLPVSRRFDGFSNGLFIELKLPGFTPSAVKPDQRDWHDYLRSQGYSVEVCGGWIDAANTIMSYLRSDVRIDNGA